MSELTETALERRVNFLETRNEILFIEQTAVRELAEEWKGLYDNAITNMAIIADDRGKAIDRTGGLAEQVLSLQEEVATLVSALVSIRTYKRRALSDHHDITVRHYNKIQDLAQDTLRALGIDE